MFGFGGGGGLRIGGGGDGGCFGIGLSKCFFILFFLF